LLDTKEIPPAFEYLGKVDQFKVGDAPQAALDLSHTGALKRRAGVLERCAGGLARRAGALARCKRGQALKIDIISCCSTADKK
jgi:hypothetical protein